MWYILQILQSWFYLSHQFYTYYLTLLFSTFEYIFSTKNKEQHNTGMGGSLSFRENIAVVIFYFWVVILMRNNLTKKIHFAPKWIFLVRLFRILLVIHGKVYFCSFVSWLVILMQNQLPNKSHLCAKKMFYSYSAHFPNKLPNFLDFARFSWRITTKRPSAQLCAVL